MFKSGNGVYICIWGILGSCELVYLFTNKYMLKRDARTNRPHENLQKEFCMRRSLLTVKYLLFEGHSRVSAIGHLAQHKCCWFP